MKPGKNKDLQNDPGNKNNPETKKFDTDLTNAGDMAYPTLSSGDEEGILDNPSGNDLASPDSNVTPEEKELLSDAAKKSGTADQRNLDAARLDQVDEDGEQLNEKSDLAGDDLDVPGSELDDDNEAIGEEDEENNPYSVDEENE